MPSSVRASLLSLESWAGSISYVLFFPFAGWLVDEEGSTQGWLWIAGIMLAFNIALGVWSAARGAWRRDDSQSHGLTDGN